MGRLVDLKVRERERRSSVEEEREEVKQNKCIRAGHGTGDYSTTKREKAIFDNRDIKLKTNNQAINQIAIFCFCEFV